MSDWHARFTEMARLVATWSKDPSTKVGAVIADSTRLVRGLGYNGFPRGVADEDVRYATRPVKYKMIVHAEANAILNARGDVRGCTLYSTKHPCSDCAKLVIQAGIASVHCPPPDERWAEDAYYSHGMLGEAGVLLVLKEE